MKPRNDPRIWRLAEWLYKNISCKWEEEMDDRFDDMKRFSKCSTKMRNFFYDRALDLFRRVGMVSTLGLL